MNQNDINAIDKTKMIHNNKNRTILIVDDEKDDLDSMSQILSVEGYSVLTCTDGTEALQTLSEKKVDLILLDFLLPTLSGYDLIKILRDKIAKDIPIIYVSIKPQIEVDTTNVDGFIQKPFDPNSLINEINQIFTNFNK